MSRRGQLDVVVAGGGVVGAAAALMVAVEALQSQGALVRHPLNPRLFLEQAFARYVDVFDRRAGSDR